jgi:FemAB-related protein (PEP-CTERM system-associated)
MTCRIVVAPIDDPAQTAQIDHFLSTQAEASPFHRPAWMGAVERACRHRAYYLTAVQGGTIKGVLPLHHVRSALFGNAMVSAGFAVGGGVLAGDPLTARALADAAWALARELDCPSLELRAGSPPSGAEWHVDRETYAGFIRALATDDERELAGIPRKQRAEVRRSLGFDLECSVGRGDADRKAHYRVYSESVRNLGTPVFPGALFSAVLDAFGDDADILTVRHQGEPVASVLSLYHRGTVMPYWGGGTKGARGLRANDFMYFALMRHARERGCSHFDFGRSKTGTGAFAFKKNWGFAPESLTYAFRTADGSAPRAINPLDPKYRLKIAMWQRLPLMVTNRIGPIIARGLG